MSTRQTSILLPSGTATVAFAGMLLPASALSLGLLPLLLLRAPRA